MIDRTELDFVIKKSAQATEEYLEKCFFETDNDVSEVVSAMKYSLFAGGKRIRPLLVLAFCRLFGGEDSAALPFAAALEMIHTFSLIHDDLPCMDNDDFRRGKPTCHRIYGEATALLAGDALALKAFGVAAQNKAVSAQGIVSALRILSDASAENGMVGGQIIDMYGEKGELSFELLNKLHKLKTGSLIRAAALLGVLAAGKSIDSEEAENAEFYADRIGLAFQIVDDLLDRFGDSEKLGKPVGSDAANSKTTFLSFMSKDEAREFAKKLTDSAVEKISHYPNSDVLCTLAYSLLEREK